MLLETFKNNIYSYNKTNIPVVNVALGVVTSMAFFTLLFPPLRRLGTDVDFAVGFAVVFGVGFISVLYLKYNLPSKMY